MHTSQRRGSTWHVAFARHAGAHRHALPPAIICPRFPVIRHFLCFARAAAPAHDPRRPQSSRQQREAKQQRCSTPETGIRARPAHPTCRPTAHPTPHTRRRPLCIHVRATRPSTPPTDTTAPPSTGATPPALPRVHPPAAPPPPARPRRRPHRRSQQRLSRPRIGTALRSAIGPASTSPRGEETKMSRCAHKVLCTPPASGTRTPNGARPSLRRSMTMSCVSPFSLIPFVLPSYALPFVALPWPSYLRLQRREGVRSDSPRPSHARSLRHRAVDARPRPQISPDRPAMRRDKPSPRPRISGHRPPHACAFSGPRWCHPSGHTNSACAEKPPRAAHAVVITPRCHHAATADWVQASGSSVSHPRLPINAPSLPACPSPRNL